MNYPQSLEITRWLRLPMVALMSLTLVACGGSDGDSTSSANTPIVLANVTRAASLSGDQELVPTLTGGVGTGTLTVSSLLNAVAGGITINGLSATAAHIHQGEVGANGPIIVELTQSAPGVWSVPAGATLTQAQTEAFASGGLYFNAHTPENPGGEIRGQIGREVSAAQLTSAQEIPTNASTATGNGLFSFDPVTKKFSARLSLTGLAATAAHIHSGTVGNNGPVLFPLTETAPSSRVWVSAADAVLTDAQVTLLNNGGLYFNAHSTTFSGGEIRGQIGRNVRIVPMSAAQEMPTNASTATGTGTLIVEPSTRAVSGSFTVTGMNARAGHIHLGAAGVNGGIIIDMTTTATSPNVFSVPAGTVFTADQFKAFKQGGLYFNAHSATFPGGEIRGQIR